MSDDYPFDEPGDLSWLGEQEDVLVPDDMMDDEFYEPFPGEE